jgi:hypothetical protein
MKVTWEVEEAKNLVRVVAEFDTHEIASLHLDHLDRALLREPHEEPADILLKAEMIARRLQYRTRMETPAECGECNTKEHCKRPYGICVRATANR